MKVDKYVKGAVRQFAYWFAHGTTNVSFKTLSRNIF